MSLAFIPAGQPYRPDHDAGTWTYPSTADMMALQNYGNIWSNNFAAAAAAGATPPYWTPQAPLNRMAHPHANASSVTPHGPVGHGMAPGVYGYYYQNHAPTTLPPMRISHPRTQPHHHHHHQRYTSYPGPPQPTHQPYYPVTQPTMPVAMPLPSIAFAPRLAPAAMLPAPVVSTAPSACAPAEYDDNQMAEFLSSMTYNVMSGHVNTWTPQEHEEFRRFVLSILRAMRLTKSTIILSLVYLSHRWSLGDIPLENNTSSFYMFFVVSLVLANKMHDDNTFTNASWCQATGIKAADITRAESAWLHLVNWNLNIGCGENGGWAKWHECWLVFCSQVSPPSAPSSALNSTLNSTLNSPVASTHSSSSTNYYQRLTPPHEIAASATVSLQPPLSKRTHTLSLNEGLPPLDQVPVTAF